VDAAKFVCNALAPAEISRVIIDESNRSMEVIVPDDYLSIAIGKRGQNVRLASKLTGWHLDVQSESLYNETMKSGYESLVALPDVGVSMADALYEAGFFSVDEISIASVEDLMQVRDVSEETAQTLISAARQAVLDAEEDGEEENEVQGSEDDEVEPEGESDAEAPGDLGDEAGSKETALEADTVEAQTSESEVPAETDVDLEPKA
jgi:N utilization substance protein A